MSRVEPNRNVYVGHRYVPKIFGEWDQQNEYEGLSIVTHQGTSYTSKKLVPVGIDILNDEFWVVTGNYNAQIEYYREETERISKKLDSKSDITYVDTELGKKSDITYVDTELGKKSDKTYVDTELDKKSDITYVDEKLDHMTHNVLSYGAVGDGINNDLNSINTVINKVKQTGGGKILFPNTENNIYMISDTLKLPSNITVEFSPGVELKMIENTDKILLTNDNYEYGNTNIKIIGGIFNINALNQTVKKSCVYFERIRHSIFKNMKVSATKFGAYETIGSFHLKDSDFNIVENCEVTESGDEGLYIIGENNKVIGGRFYNNPYGSGVTTVGKNCEILNVYSHNNGGSNISTNGDFSLVKGCTSINGLTNGIVVGHINKEGHNSIITNNFVSECQRGIMVQSFSNNVNINNNNVTEITEAGIQVSNGANHSLITGNMVSDSGSGIVGFGSSSIELNIIDNVVENCNKEGIQITNSVQGIINNNKINDVVTNGINLIGEFTAFNMINSNKTNGNERGLFVAGINNMLSNNMAFNSSVYGINETNESNSYANNFTTPIV